jgi:hypothetical protein
MKMYGPLNSGAAAGSAGSATANATGTARICGEVYGVYVKYNDSPPAATTDVTIATLGTSPFPPTVTILSLANAATDGWFYPRIALASTAGAAITYDGTRPIYGCIPVDDYIKVTIAQANSADNVDVWLLVD